jgi:hypothetical protein
MLSPNDVELGSTVSFELYPSLLIAAGYTRARVEGILNFTDANHYIDATAVHINVYPTLPPGVPNRADGYYYLKLKLLSGEITVVGLPWIKSSTYVVVESDSLRFTIPNVNVGDEAIIRTQLAALGYTLMDVEYLGVGT